MDGRDFEGSAPSRWSPCAKGGAIGSLIGSCLACVVVWQLCAGDQKRAEAVWRLWAGDQKRADTVVRAALSSDCEEALLNPAAPLSKLLRCEGEASRAKARARRAFLRRTKAAREEARAAELDAASAAISDLEKNPHVYNMVGSWNDWKEPEPMSPDDSVLSVSGTSSASAASSSNLWKFPVTIQTPADGAKNKHHVEEFQILVDGAGWENVRWRLFPSSADKSLWLLLPGRVASPAGVASAMGEGAHGRNWRVRGFPGDSFLVAYDAVSREVRCEAMTSTTSTSTTHATSATSTVGIHAFQVKDRLASNLTNQTEDARTTTQAEDARTSNSTVVEQQSSGFHEEAGLNDAEWANFDFGGEPEAAKGCHDAREGEDCYHNAMWAKTYGITKHPEWYPGLTPHSRLVEFQAALHGRGLGGCGAPCRLAEEALPEPLVGKN